jgi:hypothetical protein
MESDRYRGVWCGVPKRVEDSCKPLSCGQATPEKAISGAAHPQGLEGSGMAGPDETLESPWPPLAIRP